MRSAEPEPESDEPEDPPEEVGQGAFESLLAALELCQVQVMNLADEQAAQRRMAMLAAQAVSPEKIFRAVSREIGELLGADYVVINRYEPDDSTTSVGHWSRPGSLDVMPPLTGHWPIQNGSVTEIVARTGKPGRVADYTNAETEMGEWARERGIRSVVACPVIVEGRVWGMISSLSTEAQPEDTEARILQLGVFAGAAIDNAEIGAQLHASRARVIAASDATRRRIERNLHDGVQQRLISLGLQLRTAETCLEPGQDVLRNQLARTAQGLTDVLEDLREISRGLHPASLSRGGLRPALTSLVRRFAIPVELNVSIDGRLPEVIEVAVYYIVSEALTNVLRHAHANRARVDLSIDRGAVRVSVNDDGIGGAELGHGTGLIGLIDRTEALGGTFQLESPLREGTSLLLKIPLRD
ncbi:GAF domain-containing sensor histidine kinase [Actinomadura sp. DC4]|uniref:GAF domain-containing sensor histidine kinase n=1 Tax=Actinomadura sp. DC4 TaxID=3055069 RepID=UPI0025AFE7E3|nr:GAF domain-containing sensor histidine kinase [Actinomadura sp. DC4]MDN3358128.1 GAF domain-containing sensor histidine kinase [Actinomadura sp. DC4]